MTVSPEQCRAARSLLGMKQDDLCRSANVTSKTLSDFERGETTPYASTLEKLQKALEDAGVMFIEDGANSAKGGPGVRLAKG